MSYNCKSFQLRKIFELFETNSIHINAIECTNEAATSFYEKLLKKDSIIIFYTDSLKEKRVFLDSIELASFWEFYNGCLQIYFDNKNHVWSDLPYDERAFLLDRNITLLKN